MKLTDFIDAQASVYAQALGELREGHKQSHWMWFIFPQIAGLGQSAMSRAYAIQSLAEACAYLADPTLGARLRECCQAVMDVRDKCAYDIFGPIDEKKFHSSLTLFAEADPDDVLFHNLLEKYFDGDADEATLSILATQR